MNKLRPVLVFTAILMIMTVSITPSGGRAGGQKELESQLGARFLTLLPKIVREGQKFEAVIVDTKKLTAFGIVNLKRGDKVRLIKGPGESDFFVEFVQRISLTADDKGVLKRTAY
jgi:hypothetical protein